MKPRADRLFFTSGEVAARLRVGPRTVRRLIRTQELTAQRIDGEFFIEDSDLAAFIEAHAVSAHPEQNAGSSER